MSFSEELLNEVDGLNVYKVKGPIKYLGKYNSSIESFSEEGITVTLKNGTVMTSEDFEVFCNDILYDGYPAQDGKIYFLTVPQLVKNSKWSGRFEIIEEILDE